MDLPGLSEWSSIMGFSTTELAFACCKAGCQNAIAMIFHKTIRSNIWQTTDICHICLNRAQVIKLHLCAGV
jgi:hypothetical protein